MAEVAFAIPIVPGQEQLDRETFHELEGRGGPSTRRRWQKQA